MNNFNHVMLDLETMGNTSNSVIVSIGAVPFDIDSGIVYEENIFYEKIDIDSCLNVGLEVNGSTIYWWLKQNKKAQKELLKNKITLNDALKKFYSWFLNLKEEFKTLDGPFIWGNGATFDITILSNAYDKIKLPEPWHYRNERDLRTLVAFEPTIREKVIVNNLGYVEHNPIDDCKLQIKYCSEIWNYLKKNK